MTNQPYYQDDHVQLWHGDFRDVLPDLDVTADLVIADPPYGATALQWDRWPPGWPSKAPGCSMWCFGSVRMFLEHVEEFTAGGWKLSHDVVWEKHNGSGFVTDRFRRTHETVTHWYRGRWDHVYTQVPTTMDAVAKQVRRRGRTPHLGRIGDSSYTSHDGGPRLMTSVLHVPSTHGHAINETEKPRGILEPLIEYACPPGGVVVDLFSGSGAVLVAARALGRRAVGFEVREAQCATAARLRLAQGVLPVGGAG